MISGPDNPIMQQLVVAFRKQFKTSKKMVYDRIAELLLKPSRKKEGVNITKLSKYASEGDVVAIPAKVLSLGTLTKKVNVYALSYSAAAKAKIEKAGGKALPLMDLIKAKAEPSKIKILI